MGVIIRLVLTWLAGALVVFSLIGKTATAETPEPDKDCLVKVLHIGEVVKVKSGHSVVLADGAEVRLVSILSPNTGPDRHKSEGLSYSKKTSMELLSHLLLGQQVELGFGGRVRDRYGRLLAHLYLLRDGERLWVQRILVEQGLALVTSFADNRACVRLLQYYESAARREGLGLWRLTSYKIQNAEHPRSLLSFLNEFHIVEGVVQKVADVRGRVFLNFGADWRSDFTATIAKKDRRVFAKADMDLESFAGWRIRVRGWIERWNGPVIKLTHPEQIEVIGKGALRNPEQEADMKKIR